MQKTLLAVALTAACAAPAFAADVQVYGLIDTSLSYVHTDADQGASNDKNDSFGMETSNQFGSRFGIRGSEDLGNGYKIGFVLESGIESDTGGLDSKQSGRLFGREAQVTVSGDFGALSFGRMPIFGSVLGANGLFRAIDPINANYPAAIGSGYATASMWTRVDNAVSYKTPTFAGLTGYAMYSFQNDSVKQKDWEEGSNETDRYASLALRYQQGPLEAVLVADTTEWGNKVYGADVDDGITVTLGGNYTFANQLKLIAFYQYFDNQNMNVMARGGVAKDGIIATANDYGFVSGWGASIGANYPVGNGVARASFNYRDMDNKDVEGAKSFNNKDVIAADFERWTVAANYDYFLSKRTTLYTMLGYSEEKVTTAEKTAKPNGYQFLLGMNHKF